VPFEEDLAIAERAARAAGEVIRRYYAASDVVVETKADASPVTVADRDANTVICEILRSALPADAILSEESPDDVRRLSASRVWIIDPLDGTRDFVSRTGQFGVHVALSVDGTAVVGAVYQPVGDVLYSARAGGGAWRTRGERRERITISGERDPAALRVGVSRLNASSLLGRFLASAGLETRAVAMGASTKHMAVAEGGLDAVVSLSLGENEWDTCAPEVVVREAGGQFTDGDGNAFRYNLPDTTHYRGSIASNGHSHAWLVQAVAPFVAEVKAR
jgi:3'(2'), 5'-bisphosphate nucleotidase